MKIKYFLIIGLMLCGSAFWAGKILAQSADAAPEISFPVAELGNCKDKDDCRAYCDLPQNIEACVAFGEKNNLMPAAEVQLAKKFIAAGAAGPGGCRGKDACEAYCDNVEHIDECVEFAEKNDLMPAGELAEAKQIQAALKRGVKMPGCSSKSSCDAYCEAPEHMEECISFGAEAGFIQGEELVEAQKMLSAVKRGVKPPPCRGKDACDVYCSTPENMEMCMNFALEAGFMSEEEVAGAQKMLSAVKKGVKPPACRGRAECDTYCSSEEHFEECTNFAEAAGFMSTEEAAMARKTKGKTPGNCRGKEECEAFCNNPDNQETCFNFAKENGLISEEDSQKMEEGKKQMQQSLNNLPPEVMRCVNTQLGADIAEKIKSGEMMPSRELGEKMSECFRQMGPPPAEGFQGGPPGEGLMPPGGQFSGPGGCTSPEECRAFCESNPQECQQFAPPQPPPDGQFQPPTNGQYPPPEFNNQAQQLPPNSIPYDNQRVMEGFEPPPGVNCSNPEECKQIIQEQVMPQYTQQLPLPGTYPSNQYNIQPPPDGQYQYPPEGQFQPPTDAQYPPPEGQFQPPSDGQYPPPPDQTYQAPPPSEPTYAPDTTYQQ